MLTFFNCVFVNESMVFLIDILFSYEQISRYFSDPQYYFQVNDHYVRNKLKVVLFPFLHRVSIFLFVVALLFSFSTFPILFISFYAFVPDYPPSGTLDTHN